MSAQGKVFEVVLSAKATMPPEEYWRIWRYMNAAHIVAVVEVDTWEVPPLQPSDD
jgi:hypothetical protein